MPKQSPVTGNKFKKTVIKPQKSRALIREFHNLLKRKSQVELLIKNSLKPLPDLQDELDQINKQLEAKGGLKGYQNASISGQKGVRGGDSSKLLIQWISNGGPTALKHDSPTLLEVGCLDVNNACSTSQLFSKIDRLDLNSQDPRIEQQDFMDRPLPPADKLYTVLSLSLVVNYVPDPIGRGKMLERTNSFLEIGGFLFFVLPEPCINNSRYCTQELIESMIEALGYKKLEYKNTSKIVYWLFEKISAPKKTVGFAKKLINPGPGRNNFCIVLD